MEPLARPQLEPLRIQHIKPQVSGRPGVWDLGHPGEVLKKSVALLALSAGRLSAWRLGKSKARGIVSTVVEAAPGSEAVCEVYSSQRMNESEILRNIHERHGWTPKDKGAGGNCLFLSMAPQVYAEDLRDVLRRHPEWESSLGSDLAERWEDLEIKAKALKLREMAIMDEKDFVAELQALRASGEKLTTESEWRMRELFTDMLEEFVSTYKHGLGAAVMKFPPQGIYDRVKELVAQYNLDQVHDFVLKHADEYMETTGREGNWAGSSEMAALSSVLKRQILAYGNNFVTQDEVKVKELEDGGKEVLPYFDARCFTEARGDAIRVFQTQGGGHYQLLD